MNISDCALRVASHFNCVRHQFHYSHWNWELEDDQIIQDERFSTATAPGPFQAQERLQPPQKPVDQEASREASLDIFRWFILSGEGFPLGRIYKDKTSSSLGFVRISLSVVPPIADWILRHQH